MRTPDRSPEFEASGRTLVTDVPRTNEIEIDWDHRNEKIDSALRFGRNLSDLVAVAWGGNPGQPTVSLGVPDVGVVTFIVYTPHGDYVVKAVRVEEYAQEF